MSNSSLFLRKCDKAISYDADDSRKFRLIYAPLSYGKVCIPYESTISEINALFVEMLKIV